MWTSFLSSRTVVASPPSQPLGFLAQIQTRTQQILGAKSWLSYLKTNETKSLECLKDKTIKVMMLWYQLRTECEQMLGNYGQCRTLVTIPARPPSLPYCQSLERRVWRGNKQKGGMEVREKL